MEEIWMDVRGYKGLYKVSNMGVIKSLAKEWTAANGSKRKKIKKLRMETK